MSVIDDAGPSLTPEQWMHILKMSFPPNAIIKLPLHPNYIVPLSVRENTTYLSMIEIKEDDE